MCDPTLIVGGAMLLQGGTALFSAGSQARAGERTGRLAVWQAVQDSKASVQDAKTILDESQFTAEALVEQSGFVTAALSAQLGQTVRGTFEQLDDTRRASTELLATTSRATIEQLADSSDARVDQALRAARTFGLSMDIARSNAEMSLMRGNFEENRQIAETGRQLATTTAYFAANNMDPTYGSPLLLQAFGAAQGDADAKIIRAGALTEAAGFEWERLKAAEAADDIIGGAGSAIDLDYRVASRVLDTGYQTTKREIDFADRAADRTLDAAFEAAGITIAGNYSSLTTQLTGLSRTAQIQSESVVRNAGKGITAATIAADNARKAGQFGAATTLLNTAANWASMAMGGKLSSIGVKV